jgi:hypothetical protein
MPEAKSPQNTQKNLSDSQSSSPLSVSVSPSPLAKKGFLTQICLFFIKAR